MTMIKVPYIVLASRTCLPIHAEIFEANEDDTIKHLLEHVRDAEPTVIKSEKFQPLAHYIVSEPINTKQSVTNIRSAHDDWKTWLVAHSIAGQDDDEPLSSYGKQRTDSKAYILVICDVKYIERPPILPSITEEDVHPSRLASDTGHEEIASIARRKVGPPSSTAKLENMIKTQKPQLAEAIFNGRPTNLQGPTVTIYDSVFASFRNEVKIIPNEIPSDIETLAHRFIQTSSRFYQNENERHTALEPILEILLGCYPYITSFFIDGQEVRPDMHSLVACGLYSVSKIFKLIVEIKNGEGTGGCDAQDQGAKVYQVSVVNSELSDLRKVSCMPTFLLSIVGTKITVCGAIYLDGVVTQPLMRSLDVTPGADDIRYKPLVRNVAHVFMTLRKCMDTLARDYLNITPNLVASVNNRSLRPAPHFDLLPDGTRLTYQKRIRDSRNPRAVFIASALSPQGSTEMCFVKFTDDYCEEAHKLLEAMSAAPKLMHCKLEPSIGLYCVVTKLIREPEDPRLSAEGADKLRNAISVLHENEFVFGDLREANVVFDENHSPYLIDFDWSGKVKEVRYPFNINLAGEIDWAEGVKANEIIEKEHDLMMLRKYLCRLNV